MLSVKLPRHIRVTVAGGSNWRKALMAPLQHGWPSMAPPSASRPRPLLQRQSQPWRGLAAQKVRFSFGSNAPAGKVEPFALLSFGLNREETLLGLTVGGAWASFGEGRFGRIAIGQRADFILLDRDPMLATPEELRAIKVSQTWVGGKLVWQAQAGK